MQISFIDNMMKSIQGKIYSVRMKYRKATYAKDLETPVDIEHATLELSQAAKYVDVYYNYAAVAILQKIISLSNKYAADHGKYLSNAMKTIELYVHGWSEMKELTKENLDYLSYNVERALETIVQYAQELKALTDRFDVENSTDILVDHVRLSLYAYTTEFPYRRAYNALLKKSSMKIEIMHRFMIDDVTLLDTLIELLNILDEGWKKCGKSLEFDKYREYQASLMGNLYQLVDTIEKDIQLCEAFIKYGTTPLNFKVFPVIRKK